MALLAPCPQKDESGTEGKGGNRCLRGASLAADGTAVDGTSGVSSPADGASLTCSCGWVDVGFLSKSVKKSNAHFRNKVQLGFELEEA